MVATGVMLSYFLNCKCNAFPSATKFLMGFPVGIGIHMKRTVNIWRIPFAMQLVPAGIMAIGLFTVKVKFPYLPALRPRY